MNNVNISGRLARDPKVWDNSATFTLAVPKKYKKEGGKSADFIECIAFGNTREFVANYLVKGTAIMVGGRLGEDSKHGVDGEFRYSCKVIAESIEFMESKKAAVETATVTPVPQSHDFTIVNETELPFK